MDKGIAYTDTPGADFVMFEHIEKKKALYKETLNPIFVVETINWTIGKMNPKTEEAEEYHFNRYVIYGWKNLTKFLSYWNREMGKVAEDRVAIRMVTQKELNELMEASEKKQIVAES